MSKSIKVSIIGLGYVGLALAIEFGKKYKVLGFDIRSHGGRYSDVLKAAGYKM